MKQTLPTLRWHGDVEGYLVLLDQTRLPEEIVQLECREVQDVWQAIKRLAVRGAPAIGCAAAYGVCLSLRELFHSRTSMHCTEHSGNKSPSTGLRPPRRDAAMEAVTEACDHLATSRPTAVNLFWALNRMRETAKRSVTADPRDLAKRLLAEACAIHDEDRQMCDAIGRHGADALAVLPKGSGILTHCNAGALATGGEGTALAVIVELSRRGRQPHVWTDETRPLLQGARLTAWELQQRDIDATLICDSMASQVMSEGRVKVVVTGADRIAANGDAANKIGTHGLAIVARHFQIPFYVAAPTSTIELAVESGDEIPIEIRRAEEVTHGFGRVTAPSDMKVYNPAFDVTPAVLIAGIITEHGIIEPNKSSITETVTERPSHVRSI